jgi:hypothetical protein
MQSVIHITQNFGLGCRAMSRRTMVAEELVMPYEQEQQGNIDHGKNDLVYSRFVALLWVQWTMDDMLANHAYSIETHSVTTYITHSVNARP